MFLCGTVIIDIEWNKVWGVTCAFLEVSSLPWLRQWPPTEILNGILTLDS